MSCGVERWVTTWVRDDAKLASSVGTLLDTLVLPGVVSVLVLVTQENAQDLTIWGSFMGSDVSGSHI